MLDIMGKFTPELIEHIDAYDYDVRAVYGSLTYPFSWRRNYHRRKSRRVTFAANAAYNRRKQYFKSLVKGNRTKAPYPATSWDVT